MLFGLVFNELIICLKLSPVRISALAVLVFLISVITVKAVCQGVFFKKKLYSRYLQVII